MDLNDAHDFVHAHRGAVYRLRRPTTGAISLKEYVPYTKLAVCGRAPEFPLNLRPGLRELHRSPEAMSRFDRHRELIVIRVIGDHRLHEFKDLIGPHLE